MGVKSLIKAGDSDHVVQPEYRVKLWFAVLHYLIVWLSMLFYAINCREPCYESASCFKSRGEKRWRTTRPVDAMSHNDGKYGCNSETNSIYFEKRSSSTLRIWDRRFSVGFFG